MIRLFIICFIIIIFHKFVSGQNWVTYPHPSFGSVKTIEFYKDSMLFIQNENKECYVTFDYGQSWTLAMNGFIENDFPEYITFGKDFNFYAKIRDNIYKYSIKDNYWVWLFGGFDCNTSSDVGFQVDYESNIYAYCNFYPSRSYKKTNYITQGSGYYPGKMIVLDNEKVINYHAELGTISFVDKKGNVSLPNNIIKNKRYLHYSEYYEKLYLCDGNYLYIVNIIDYKIDSIPFKSINSSFAKIFENQNHGLLFSGFSNTSFNFSKSSMYSLDGGYNYISFNEFLEKNYVNLPYLHFLPDNSILLLDKDLIKVIQNEERLRYPVPGKNILPNELIKTKETEYFKFRNGVVLYKLKSGQNYVQLKIDNTIEFKNMFKDNDGVVYLSDLKDGAVYYKLNNNTDWVKIHSDSIKDTESKYFTDENGIIYALDSCKIFYSKDKGVRWNELFTFNKGATTDYITSVGNLFYFAIKDSLYIVDPVTSVANIYPVFQYLDVSKNNKIIYSKQLMDNISTSYDIFLLDSLNASPKKVVKSSKYLSYKKLNNSFWLFNTYGIYNILDSSYYYSNQNLPHNAKGNTILLNIALDEDNFLYAITDLGVFINTEKIKMQPSWTNYVHKKVNLSIFPNPASSYIEVNAEAPIEQIEIISIDSKVMVIEAKKANNLILYIEHLLPNVYLLKCKLKYGQHQFVKFVKI